MFNTLGNFVVNPKAGILIVDFPNHQTLQMTGKAHIRWKQAADLQEREMGRSWTYQVSLWLLRPLKAEKGWEFMDFSPYNPS